MTEGARGFRREAERGSVLMLVPAAVLVLVILAAIAVDSAVVLLAQRELGNAAAAAANDAASALDDGAFYQQGLVQIDTRRAEQVALDAVLARRTAGLVLGQPRVVVAGDRVHVAVTGSVALIFARAIPGVRHHVMVTARATATAVEA